MNSFLFGRLTIDALPHEWFTIGGTIAMFSIVALLAVFISYKKSWTYLWKKWFTSTDPKKIGIMYIIVATAMLFRGGLDAGMIWFQQAMSLGASHGYLSAEHFQEIFTAHGVIMVFFVTMGFLFGLLNYIVPLQIGARDLASPFLNTLGFWLYVAGAVMINLFFIFGGQFSPTGWLAIAPLSGIQFNPGVGVDYWIWSLQVSGLGTLLGGINFIMTIIKMRAPGMSLMKMPIFTWASLCSMLMVVTVFPLLTATITLLSLDRLFGFHFFTTDLGGSAMMYTNLIWMWGHPEVYILMLPAFGIYSEVVSTFSQKRLTGYVSAVAALIGVSAISMVVWLHHFFTMGSGADVNAFFGISTMLIAIPTGVQFFNWIATMHKGRIRLLSPMRWFLGFAATFIIGGMAGVLLATPPVDFQIHNSLFLVAHFHTMVIGGALFGIFAGITYWFPKVTGYKLSERFGLSSFLFWLIGFVASFGPLYVLGLMGATRRLDHYTDATWQPLFITSAIGFVLISIGTILLISQLVVSFREKKKAGGDPWNARTLEWATSSPPPFYNFPTIPQVFSRDAFWEIKMNKKKRENLEEFEMPKNTAMGIYISIAVFIFGFAMVWQIFWLAGISLVAGVILVLLRTFDEKTEYVMSTEKIKAVESKLNY